MKRYLCLGLSLLLLCGCTSTVSTVTDPPDSSPSPTPLVLAEDVVPLEQALAESRELDLQDSVNLKFLPGLEVECSDTVYQGQVMQLGDFADQYSDTLLHWWVPDEVWDDAYLTPQEEQMNLYPLGPTYEDENGWYADVWCTGSVVYSRDGGDDLFFNTGEYDYTNSYALFSPDTNTQDSYPVDGGALTIAQAAEMGNEFAEAWCGLTDYPLELRVEYVEVYDRKDGTYFFQLNYQSCLNQVPLNTINDTFCKGGMDYMAYSSMHGIIASVDGPCYWGTGNGGVVPYEVTPCASILPLKDAIQRLSDKLSAYTAYDVQRVALEYRLTVDGTAQTPDQYRLTDEEGNSIPDVEVNTIGGSYQLYQLHPLWVFYMDETPDKELVCYVDARTGEVSFIDNRPVAGT